MKTFVQNVIKTSEKTEKDQLKERAEEFVEDCKIECELQITNITTGDIPKRKNEIKRAKNELTKAKKDLAKVEGELAEDFKDFMEKRNTALRLVERRDNYVKDLEYELKLLENELAEYNKVLTIFTAETE